MAYISDLAKELNRIEGMVTKMLKTSGYLKENGSPRKATIDAGFMREDGFIYKKGFKIFIEELRVKNKEHDDYGEVDKNEFPIDESYEFIEYKDKDSWWEGEYRGWRIRSNKTIAEKNQKLLSAIVWSVLKDEIDNFEDKREKLFSQCGKYRDWEITEFSDDRIVAKKDGFNDINAYLGSDIRKEIDKVEAVNKITYKENYCGWKITQKKGDSGYSAEKKGTHIIIQNMGTLKCVKEAIDNEEEKLKEERSVLANPDKFSEQYNGWTITIKNGKLIAQKKGEPNLHSSLDLKKQGLAYCKKYIYDLIERYEIHKNEPQDNQKAMNDEELHYDFWKNEWV